MKINNWRDYSFYRSKVKHPTIEMDAFLCSLVVLDDVKAKEELIKNYYNLAYSISKKCVGRGCEFDDLLQSAQIGLLYAATKYDPQKSKFSTYATPWIWQHCLRLIENTGRTIRLPNHIHELLIVILREGVELSLVELEYRLSVPADKIDSAISGYKTQTMPIDDFIEHSKEDYKMDEILDDLSVEQAMNLFKNDELTLKVFSDYAGLNDDDVAYSFSDLSQIYKLPENQIRDIVNRAIEILKEHLKDK